MQAVDERHEAELWQKDEIIHQKDIQMNQLQVCININIMVHRHNSWTLYTYIICSGLADIGQLQSESEQHTRAIQQLNAQLRESNNRHRQRKEELQIQLQQKDEELQQRSTDLSRLQREIQRLQVSVHALYSKLVHDIVLCFGIFVFECK